MCSRVRVARAPESDSLGVTKPCRRNLDRADQHALAHQDGAPTVIRIRIRRGIRIEVRNAVVAAVDAPIAVKSCIHGRTADLIKPDSMALISDSSRSISLKNDWPMYLR